MTELFERLNKAPYPPGAYALYLLLYRASDRRLSTGELKSIVDQWNHPDHPDGPPIGLNSITDVLNCADALERGEFVRRETTTDGEHWTALTHGATSPATVPIPERGNC